MEIFQKTLLILLVIVLVMYISGGSGMFGHSLGIPVIILLIFLLIKGISRKKDNK